VKAGKAR